jgi:hypothetical protein
METINDEMIESAIDIMQEMKDADYEKLMLEFEGSQELIYNFLDEQLEDFQNDEEIEDIISIVLILFVVFKNLEAELSSITAQSFQEIESAQNKLFKEFQDLPKSSDSLKDEGSSLFYLKNNALHEFILNSLDPADDSPFNKKSSEKAYLIIKICVEALSSVK